MSSLPSRGSFSESGAEICLVNASTAFGIELELVLFDLYLVKRVSLCCNVGLIFGGNVYRMDRCRRISMLNCLISQSAKRGTRDITSIYYLQNDSSLGHDLNLYIDGYEI